MQTNKIKNISIYSDSNFIAKTLSQFCKDFICETFSYSCFTSTTMNVRPSIALIDIRNQMVFDKIIEPALCLHSLYPVLLLLPDHCLASCSSVDIIRKPFQYKMLLERVNHLANSPVQQVSDDMFLNSKTLNLIKISGQIKAEIKLTASEFQILSYLLGANKPVTEREILNYVFKYNDLAATNTFNVHLHRLKQKLGKDIIERKSNGTYAIKDLKQSVQNCASAPVLCPER